MATIVQYRGSGAVGGTSTDLYSAVIPMDKVRPGTAGTPYPVVYTIAAVGASVTGTADIAVEPQYTPNSGVNWVASTVLSTAIGESLTFVNNLVVPACSHMRLRFYGDTGNPADATLSYTVTVREG